MIVRATYLRPEACQESSWILGRLVTALDHLSLRLLVNPSISIAPELHSWYGFLGPFRKSHGLVEDVPVREGVERG